MITTISPKLMKSLLDRIEELTREDIDNDYWLDEKKTTTKFCQSLGQEVECNIWILDRKGTKVRIEFFERPVFKPVQTTDGSMKYVQQDYTTFEVEAFLCTRFEETPIDLAKAFLPRECDIAKDANITDRSYETR